MAKVYEEIADYYDLMYYWKDYKAEAAVLCKTLEEYGAKSGGQLLEVACGTANYTPYFAPYYTYTGLDISTDMLKVANKKFPTYKFVQGDMANFKLAQKFDVILCLFSSIAYNKTYEQLAQTLQNFYAHMSPNAILIFELFVDPDKYMANQPFMLVVDKPDVKLSRHNVSERVGDMAVLNMHTLVTTAKGTKYFSSCHHLMLFDPDRVATIVQAIGFKAQRIGIMKSRTTFVCVRE